MVRKLQVLIMSLVIAVSGGVTLLPATGYAADSPDSLTSDACAGLNTLNGKDGVTTCDAGSGNRINNILRFTINIFSVVVGFIAVLMIIINGLRFITANGDSSAVASARSGVLYALIGLVIVALAQVFVAFVISRSSTCAYNSKLKASDTACKAPAS